MKVNDFKSIVDKIAQFCGDAVIDISLWGEPSLHPEIFDIANTASGKDGISLIIETSGIGWDEAVLRRMSAELTRPPTWIVSLDARTEKTYESLRGKGFAEAQKTALKLMEIFPDSVHVQAVRMNENEEDLEGFYSAWKDKKAGIIVQKYDWFCGYLPQKKVSDLSPVTRFPCWHLRRDMPVLLDGTVVMCREDVERRHILGNVFSQELGDIWEKGKEMDRRHRALEYPELCAACDEWYTYNA